MLAIFSHGWYNNFMNSLVSRKSVISQEDMADCIEFVKDFSAELRQNSGRLSGSEDETACARQIRNRLHDETDAKTRMEAFWARPTMGRRTFTLIGLWSILCYVLYYVSFAGNRLVGTLLTLVALIAFVVGNGILISLYLGVPTFQRLLKKRVSYNVVSEYGADDSRNVFVVCDHHDSMPGSIIRDFDFVRKFCTVAVPICALIFVLFCILKMAFGTQDGDVAAKISAFTIVPAAVGIISNTACLLHFSSNSKNARENNGISTSVAMATYAYFVDKPELLPEDVKIVYASFGAENSAHCGSRAFVEAHPEFANATVLCIEDVQSSVFNVVDYDALRKVECDSNVVAAILTSAREQDMTVPIMQHESLSGVFKCLHGFMSNAFCKDGVSGAGIIAKSHGSAKDIEEEDVEKLFSLCVGTMQILMKNAKHTEIKDDVAEQTGIQIVDVVGK